MSPELIALPGTEHAEQTAVFAYCAIAEMQGFAVADAYTSKVSLQQAIAHNHNNIVPVPDLHWIHAIPNGGARGDTQYSRQRNGAKMKAEGVRPGIADIFWPITSRYVDKNLPLNCGLYIEMKTSVGKVSEKQYEFGQFVKRNFYAWHVCFGWREAVSVIKYYVGAE